MKVKELKEILSKHDDNNEVIFYNFYTEPDEDEEEVENEANR